MKNKRKSLADALINETKGIEVVLQNNKPNTIHFDGLKTDIRPNSRIGKKPITGFFEPEVSKQLKLIAINENTTSQNLIAEALNELFKKRGMSPIATISND